MPTTVPPPLRPYPSSLTDLRVGDVVTLTASGVDSVGDPIDPYLPAWDLIAGDGAVTINATSDLVCEVEAVGPPGGTDAVSFAHVDGIEQTQTETLPTAVLDASTLVLRMTASSGVSVRVVNNVWWIRPTNGAASITLKVDVYDDRGFSGGFALSDGPNWSSLNGKVLFDGSPTDTDDEEVAVTFTSFGDDTINVVATTDESEAIIHGSLDVKIIGIEDVSFAFDSGK